MNVSNMLASSNEENEGSATPENKNKPIFQLKNIFGSNSESSSNNRSKQNITDRTEELFSSSETNSEFQKSQNKELLFEQTIEKKAKLEDKYNKKKSTILRNPDLTLKEKKSKLQALSKTILSRKSFYDKTGFDTIGKTLKRGIKMNNIDPGSRDNISFSINESKNKLIDLKHKLLYGFFTESEIEYEFNELINDYKRKLKKRQNIDYQNESKNKNKKDELIELKNKLVVLNKNLNELLKNDKTEAIRYFIEEIKPLREEIFKKSLHIFEVIKNENNNEFYIYSKKI